MAWYFGFCFKALLIRYYFFVKNATGQKNDSFFGVRSRICSLVPPFCTKHANSAQGSSIGYVTILLTMADLMKSLASLYVVPDCKLRFALTGPCVTHTMWNPLLKMSCKYSNLFRINNNGCLWTILRGKFSKGRECRGQSPVHIANPCLSDLMLCNWNL